MALTSGNRLGPYEIISALGAGGMGEVYRARDPRLGRDVAVKVLPAGFSADPERLVRFEQEARSAAALNHPNILAVHDIGQHDGAPYIVAELLDGETLRERLSAGALPVRKAVEYAVQIAHGLAAAHEKGIVHRDLKPDNVFVTSDGRVKILDFGLAKLTQAEPTLTGASALPTTPPNTVAGMVLGTIGYMAPEQVRGLAADHRSDIFAFGAVLYEMLCGERAFHGDTAIDTMTAILKEDPPDLPAAERHIPPGLARIVDRCLEKRPAARFQSMRDLAFALEGLSSHSDSAAAIPSVGPRRSRERLGWSAAGLFGVVAGLLAIWALKPEAPQGGSGIARLAVALPPGDQVGPSEFPALALSADGTQLVYVGVREGRQQLYSRAIDGLESNAIPATEGASCPFFSPDGQWVGFFASGKLKKVSVAAGTVQIVADAPNGRGGSWGGDGTIYFAPDNFSGLWKVPDSGGTPTEATRLDRGKGEVSHRWPQMLPGGTALLFTVWTGPGRDEKYLHVQSLSTGERHLLVQGGDTGRYVSSGHLVYALADALVAVPIDLARFEASGTAPVPLVEQLRGANEGAQYAVSDSGALIYLPGGTRRNERRLVWVDRQGRVEPMPGPPREYGDVAISPDGRQAAVDIGGGAYSIWIYDFARATLAPLATGGGSSQAPIWTPDGKRVVYRGTRTGFRNLLGKTVDSTSDEERLTTKENSNQAPGSFSPDGKWLVFQETNPASGLDMGVLHLEVDHKVESLLATRFNEAAPRFSPDGRWIAYKSNESGRDEIYVQPFPGTGDKHLVSTEGGAEPVWSRSGRELFYTNGEKMMAVDIAAQPTFAAGAPRLLFEGAYHLSGTNTWAYDVSPDGERFLRIQATEPERPLTQIIVVLNWFEELRAKVPTRGLGIRP